LYTLYEKTMQKKGILIMRVLIYDGSIKPKDKNCLGTTDSIPNCRKVHDALAAPSIDGAVTQLEQLALQHNQHFDVIAFCGHAASGFFGVAGNTLPTGHQREKYEKAYDFKVGKLADIQTELQRLAQLLNPNAIIYLSGCEVAEGSAGGNLLRQLSQALPGAWVVGIIEEAAVIANDESHRIELHAAINQKDIGVPEALALKVAHNGQLEDDEDAWPQDLIQEIAYWPY
jgi:hypothetical protein